MLVENVRRLETYVDIDDHADETAVSLRVRHEAELADGSRVLLLDDRGWTTSGSVSIWESTSVDQIADTARIVVGPDEPSEGRLREDMEAAHWAALQLILQYHGVHIDTSELRELQHDVILSPRLRARLSG